MIKAEFGMINKIDYSKDYSEYEPDKYKCVFIDDDLYIDEWWKRLSIMKTYYHRMNRPAFGLARWGVTLIPPESLPLLQDIVITDKRLQTDEQLVELANLIKAAIDANKFMIHYGV